jgi:hypothetical protein
MTTLPVVLILTAAAGLGAYMLLLRFRNERRPGLIAAHLLLGVGGAEALVMLLHGSGLAEDSPTRGVAKLALGFLVAAIFSGFAAPMLGRNSPGVGNGLLTAHVCCGFLGFAFGLAFASQL